MMLGWQQSLAAWAAAASRRALLIICGLFFLFIAWAAGWAALAWWLKTIWPGSLVWLLIAGSHLLLALIALLIAFSRGRSGGHRGDVIARAAAGDAGKLSGDQLLALALTRDPERVLPLLLALTPVAEAARRRPALTLAAATALGLVLGVTGRRPGGRH